MIFQRFLNQTQDNNVFKKYKNYVNNLNTRKMFFI